MNTLKNTAMIAGVIMISGIYQPTMAQDIHEPVKLNQDGIVRQDRLKADLTTPADKNDLITYERTVTNGENGFYDVIITDMQGNLRMTGRYADHEMKIADGLFTYYYPNGNVESRGMYANNVKSGPWERFAMDGTPKAERIYTGMTWEDMAVMLGVAEKAEKH